MTIVIGLVGVSINIYLRNTAISRTEVEEAHLAQAVLEQIARDIRNVVVSLREEELEVDTTSLSALSGLTGSTLPAASETTTETKEGEESGTTQVYGTKSGIYGNLEWLQIDTAKLPRGEMYGSRQVVNGTDMVDRLSPSKTVLYYLGDDTGTLSADDPRYEPEQLLGSLGRNLNSSTPRYGLFRRSLDRMVSQYAVNEGKESEYEQYDEPLAPEVEFIEFAYFDPQAGQEGGTGDWLDYWDMDEMQYLPSAVRITLGIRRPQFGNPLLSSMMFSNSAGNSESEPVIYSLIVPIPVSITPPETTEEETE
jgi:hypothetical protein